MNKTTTAGKPMLFYLHLFLDGLWVILYSIPSIFIALFYTIFGHPEKDVRGQTVLVTGSGLGVGRELCLRFAKLGCEVLCVELRPEHNQETLKLIREAGGKATGYTCDVSDRKAVLKLAKEVKRVDILINNAGIYPEIGIWNAEEEEIQTVLNVNLMSQFWMVQAFMPAMKERNSGHVVAISSMSALVGMPYFHAYSASKAGVSAFMTSLSHELRFEKKQNVKLTTIYPYFVNTHPEIVECCQIRLPVLELNEAVDGIMQGILQELPSLTLPRLLSLAMHALRILPQTFTDKCFDTFPISIITPKIESHATILKEAAFHKNMAKIQVQEKRL